MSPFQLIPDYTVREASHEEFADFMMANLNVMFPNSVRFDYPRTMDEATTLATRERRQDYDKRMVRWFVEHQGAVVGWTFGREIDPETYYMQNSAIHPDHRRKGLYSALVQAWITHLEPERYQRITSIHATTNNAVIIPKLKAGFVITAMEVNDKHGTLVTLSYYFNKQRLDALKFRTGEQQLPQELENLFEL